MRSEDKAIWSLVASRAAACGLLSAALAYGLSGSPRVCVLAFAASMIAGVVIGCSLQRGAREMEARIRRGDLTSPATRGTGLYRGFLAEAAALILTARNEAAEAARAKTELEARLHVRQKLLKQLEAALHQMEQPVLIVDERLQPAFGNAAMRKLCDGAPHAGTSSGALDLDRLPAVRQMLQELRVAGPISRRRTAELTLEINGARVGYEAAVSAIVDAERSLGMVVTLRDVTEKGKERARHAEFVASVCHELKTPMAGIRAFTEMLIDGDVSGPEEEKEILGFIEVQVDRLTRLADNMLNLSRMESGVIKVTRQDSELNELLQKAFDVVVPAAEEKGVSLASELSDLYLAVHVDRDLFAQAIINLLSNAVKYTPPGGEVRLRSRMHEREAIIEVSDTGYGIPPESLPRIFERFYRVPENAKAAEGTGLGLALAHYIVTELHNGRISVESTVNVGSCFAITIPLGHRDQPRRKSEPPLEAQPALELRDEPLVRT